MGSDSKHRKVLPQAASSLQARVINSKLAAPHTRSELVDRPGLTARLEAALNGRVILVSAPAGYGKSTLVALWLAQSSAPRSAWLSCDRLDSNLDQFSRHLVAALQHVWPGRLRKTEALLSAPTLPPPEYLAESMVVELAGLEGRAVLVLDDYDSIGGTAVHQLVRTLVQRMPDNLRLALLSRNDPPLPTALWRSRQWLCELRGNDLRFSLEETSAFFVAADGLNLGSEVVARLHQKTEGWVAGLLLAKLSLAGTTDPEARVQAFSGSERLIADYLIEEVLAGQPAEVREFLALTAPLERFCASLCEYLAADRPLTTSTRTMIERLERKNVFLSALGPDRTWYRYHQLFRQMLLDRFDDLAPKASRQEIYQRAGTWFAREGSIEEGLLYLADAGDLDGAADLVAMHLHEAIQMDISRRWLGRWLANFPPGAERGRLPLIVASAYLRTLQLDVDGACRLLDEANATCSDSTNTNHLRWRQALQPDVDCITALTRFWMGNPAGALECTTRALSVPQDLRRFISSAAVAYHSGALALSGRWEEFHTFIDEGIAEATASGSPQLGWYLMSKAIVHLYRGEMELCQETASLLAERTGDDAISKYFGAHGVMLLGSVAYERNLLEEAEAHFRHVEALRFDVNRVVYHSALLALAQISLACDDHTSAKLRAKEARKVALESGSSIFLRGTQALDWRIAVKTGGPPRAPHTPPVAPDFMFIFLDAPSHAWAWRQLHAESQEVYRATLSFIEIALSRAEEHGVEWRAIQLANLRALALDRLGRRDEAITALSNAVRKAGPLGLLRSFLDCGNGLRSLLEELAVRDPGNVEVNRILTAFSASRRVATPTSSRRHEVYAPVTNTASSGTGSGEALRNHTAWEPLTNRELDVLELLQRRFSDKEIAAELTISPATVKMHILNLYRKLDVHDRRRAVVVARDQGILR